jgi:urease accessory protein UreH
VPVVDRRAGSEIGRAARLELIFGTCDGRTVLEHAYAEPPLRVGPIFPHGSGAHLILASSAPGIFGGDSFEQTIHVRAGAIVRLSSQSALQVHPSVDRRPAVIRSRVIVEPRSELQSLWHPIVPFARSRLDQQVDVDVADTGRLFWSDAMMAGRQGRGERWEFDQVEHELRVRCAGRLIYLERHRIGGGKPIEHPWVAGDASYFGTVVRVGCGDLPDHGGAIHRALNERDGLRASADLIERDVLLVRIASDNGIAFHAAREIAMTLSTGSDASWRGR